MRIRAVFRRLCTLALLESGLEPNDPAVAQALDYIRSFGKPDTIYSVSLRTMVLCAAEPKKDLLTIRQNVAWLESLQLTDATSRGAAPAREPGTTRNGWEMGTTPTPSSPCWRLNEAERVGVDGRPARLATGPGLLADYAADRWLLGVQAHRPDARPPEV